MGAMGFGNGRRAVRAGRARAVVAVTVAVTLLAAVTPTDPAAASQWDTQDVTSAGSVQDAYPYKGLPTSQLDPRGFSYGSSASYAAWYLADNGVTVKATMEAADGPDTVKLATASPYNGGTGSWTTSTWRLGFHIKDDAAARLGDLYVGSGGSWIGVVYAHDGGWLTVAGYRLGGSGFAVKRLRVAAGDCTCILDYLNTPIDAGQGGIKVAEDTVYDMIRRNWAGDAAEVSPSAVDSTGEANGWVSLDGEASYLHASSPQDVSFPAGGSFDVNANGWVLYNRTWGDEIDGSPGPGWGAGSLYPTGVSLSPNLDHAAWITDSAMLPEDECADGVQHYAMAYQGQILDVSSLWYRMPLLADPEYWVLSAGGVRVNPDPVPVGSPGGTSGLCVPEPGRAVHSRDLYTTDLRTGDTSIATPPQLNSDTRYGQESYLGGDVHSGPKYTHRISDDGVVTLKASARAAAGYPTESPQGYLPSPLRERAVQAINLVLGAVPMNTPLYAPWGLAPPDPGWWALEHVPALGEAFQGISVEMTQSDWPAPTRLTPPCATFVGRGYWCKHDTAYFTFRNAGPWRTLVGTYDVADPAGSWNEVWGTYDDDTRSVVTVPATGDVLRPSPDLGSLQRYAPWWARCDNGNLCPPLSASLTPSGRWWSSDAEINVGGPGGGVCLEGVASGDRYDCRPMTQISGGLVERTGPNDDGEFVAVYRAEGSNSTQPAQYAAVWRPGRDHKMKLSSAALLPEIDDGGGSAWRVVDVSGVSQKTPTGRRTLATYARSGWPSSAERRFAIIEIPDRVSAPVPHPEVTSGSGPTRGQGVVAGGGRWEVGTRTEAEHSGEMAGSRKGLMGVAVKRDTGDSVPTGAAFYELSSPSRRWRVVGRHWDSLRVDTAAQAYRLERPGSTATLRGPCDVYSTTNEGGKQPFLLEPFVDRRGTYCTWTFTEGSPSGNAGGAAEFSLNVTRASGGQVVLDVPRTAVPLGPSNQLLVDAAGYDKPLSALGKRLERAAKNLAAGLVDELADDVAAVEVDYEVEQMLETLDPWVDHQLAELKTYALGWVDRLSPWLEEHVFTPMEEWISTFVDRWGVNFGWVRDGIEELVQAPAENLRTFCENIAGSAVDMADAFAATLSHPLFAGWGVNLDDSGTLSDTISTFSDWVDGICGELGAAAEAALTSALDTYVTAPLDALTALIQSVADGIKALIATRTDELRSQVNGAIASLRAGIEGFDLGSLKGVPVDPIGTCPAEGEPGYDRNCRIDLVRDWARQALLAAHDWVLDQVYEPNPAYDYHHPAGCGGTMRLLKTLHCAVNEGRTAYMDALTSQLAPIDSAIQSFAAGLSAITTSDEYDRLFHCVAGIAPTITQAMSGINWNLGGGSGIFGFFASGWANWFMGGDTEGQSPLKPNIIECLLPTPGGWWPNDADWLPLGPWEPEQVELVLYGALDFISNVVADRLSRISTDGGNANAVGRAILQMLIDLSRRTITLDGEEVPGTYVEALEKAIADGGDVSWEQVWGYLTDGMDGFTGAGLSDWQSVQSGMRCAEVRYDGEWWYDHAPDVLKSAFDAVGFLEGCAKGGWVDGVLKYFLEDKSRFLGRPLVERYTYLWDNPKGLGEGIHRLLDTWEKRLVAWVQARLPDGLRDLAGWIRGEGAAARPQVETALHDQVAGLMALLQVRAGEAASPAEAAVNAAADRVVATLDRLADTLETQAAQPWLREVAQLVAWANARLAQALTGVEAVIAAVRSWVDGLGLPAELEAAVFALLDRIHDAVVDAGQWVDDNAIEPIDEQLQGLLRLAFGAIADAIRSQRANVYALRDSLVGKFNAWLTGWAEQVMKSCGEGHTETPGMSVGVCDVVAEPVGTIYDAGVNWIAGGIENLADVIESRVSGAPRSIRAYLDDLNCELVLYVYDIQSVTSAVCDRVNAGQPPFAVKKPSTTLLNLLADHGEELKAWILDELAKAADTIRGFDLESEGLWAAMDATAQSGMQFAMFAVDPDVREALGEYLRHALSRITRFLEPLSDRQVLEELGGELGLPDLYNVIVNQVNEVVPFVRAQAYSILGSLPNIDNLALGLRSATSLADVANTFGRFGDELLTWVIAVVDEVTGDFLDLNAKVAAAIGESVLRVADNTLRAAIDGAVNVFRFVVWAHEYTFEKAITPLIALGDEVPDMWAAPGFGYTQIEGSFGDGVGLEMRFAQDHAAAPLGGLIATYPSTTRPGEWYVVASRSFEGGSFTQPSLTLEELDGNDGSLDVGGLCNVYRASGPSIEEAVAREASGTCRWALDGRAHTLAMSGPLPEWTDGVRVLEEGGTEAVRLGRPWGIPLLEAGDMAGRVQAAEDALALLPPPGDGIAEPEDPAFPEVEHWIEETLGFRGRFSPDLVSVTPAGGAATGSSHQVGGTSPDGRYVVFASDAGDLVSGDTNAKRDIFIRDRYARTTAALSTTGAGTTGNGNSARPAVSRDGATVGFASSSSDLVDGDANAQTDVFVRDLVSGATERVSVPPGGGEADNASTEPALSADGRYVAFVSWAGNLVDGDTNAAYDAFVLDRETGALERVSVSDDGSELPSGILVSGPPPGISYGTSIGISDDGDRVVFATPDGAVWVRDRTPGATWRVDVNDVGDPADAPSARPSISGDGRYVAFATTATNLTASDEPPDYGHLDVYRRDLERGRTRQVSRPASDEAWQSDGDSGESIPSAALGADGRWAVFDSTARDLTSVPGNGQRQLYARDMRARRVKALSVTPSGTLGAGGSSGARIGAAATTAFMSEAGDVAPGDGNGLPDVFASDALTPFETWMQTRLLWWLEGEEGYLADLDARRAREETRQAAVEDLATATFEMFAAFLGQVAGPGDGDGGPVIVNVTPWGAVGSAGYAAPSTPSTTADGRYVVFSTEAADLVVGDASGYEDVFRRDVVTGTTVRVSENRATGREPDGTSSSPVVSDDGRWVAYLTSATNLTAAGATAVTGSGVLLWDAETGVSSLVPGTDGASGGIAMSADGRYVVYGRGSAVGFTGTTWVYRYDRDTGTTTVANEPVSGSQPDRLSYSFDVSDDGRRVLFVSEARNLHDGDDGALAPNVLVRDMDVGVTVSAGVQTRPVGWGACDLQEAALSGDGRWVVFDSCAVNVAGDTNGKGDVYRYDLDTQTTEFVSVADDGTQGNGDSFQAAVSPDGGRVVFSSGATNLFPAVGSRSGVFVRDTAAGTTRLLSVNWDGSPMTTGGYPYGWEGPAVSADGERAVFHWGYSTLYSATTDPPPPPASEPITAEAAVDAVEAFVAAWLAGRSAEEQAAVAADADALLARLTAFIDPPVTGDPVPEPLLLSANAAAEAGDARSYDVATAPDGVAGVFTSEAANLVDGDTNAKADVFVTDAATGAVERASVASDGTQANDASAFGSLSDGGRYVAFTSLAGNLVAGDTNGVRDVFARDRQSGTTERVSVASDGSQATGYSSYGYSYGTAISADGRYVAFASESANLVADDTNGARDVFVHDRDTGVTERVSVAGDGTQGNGRSSNSWSCQDVAISADGRYVAFGSAATNLVVGDTNYSDDIFVHDRDTGVTERVSVSSAGVQGDRRSGDQTCRGSSYSYGQASPTLALSGDGRHVVFISGATNLVPGDTNTGTDWEDPGYGTPDVFVHDRDTGTTTRVNVASDGSQSSSAWSVSVRADGGLVGFLSGATFGDPYDTNATMDAFVHDMASGETRRVSLGAGGAELQGASAGVGLAAGDRAVVATGAPNVMDPPLAVTTQQAYLVTTLSRPVDVGDDVTNLLESVMGVVNQWETDALAAVPADSAAGHLLVGAVRDLLARYESAAGMEWLRRLVAGERHLRDLFAQLADVWNGTYVPPGSPVVPPGMRDAVVDRADDLADRAAGLDPEWLDRAGADSYWAGFAADEAATRGDLAALGNVTEITDTPELAVALAGLRADYETHVTPTVDDIAIRFAAAEADAGRDDFTEFVAGFAALGQSVSVFNRRLETFVATAEERFSEDPSTVIMDQIERVTGWLAESPFGLEAAYYAGPAPVGTPVEERIDVTVDFDWDLGGPAWLTDGFSAAWRGRLVSPVTGPVELTVESDDGARLWIDDALVIDDWATPGLDEVSADVALVAGVPRRLRLEYREDTDTASVRLLWRLPGEPAPVPVPSSALLAGEPRMGDLSRTITGLARYGAAAAVVMGRAETDAPRAPADVFTALLVAPAPYLDPQGSLSYTYEDGGERVTVATTSLEGVAATGTSIYVEATCVSTTVPLPVGLGVPRRDGPSPCTWALWDDNGTTRLDVSAAGISNVAIRPDWRFSLHYPS